MTTTIKTFEVGKTYYMRSTCDYDCVWTYQVVKRTAKTITIADNRGEETRCRVHEFMGEECCHPLGRYSMSPMLSAGRIK